MKIEDCTPGRTVVIGAKYFEMGIGLTEAIVVDTVPPPARPEDNPSYPYGMVKVRLADHVRWSCREPWIGPEDLALPLGAAR